MKAMYPYLTFSGKAEEAFNFYKKVLNGEITSVNRFKEMPGADQLPPGAADKIMHISLNFGNDNSLMASDTVEGMGPAVNAGNNFSLYLGADSKDEADRLFKEFSSGGQVTMPLENTFWGSYFGMCTDKFGINWMVAYDQTPQ